MERLVTDRFSLCEEMSKSSAHAEIAKGDIKHNTLED